MKNLCAIYCRVSTDNQADHGVSLPAQESRLIAYCQSQGWDVYKTYIDDGYSGKDLNRPAITRLINDAKKQEFGHVAVIKLDRLSRSQKDALYLIEDIFTRNDVSFHSISESFDTSTPFGKASLGMLSVFAQLEREMIVERIIVAKKEAAKQGRYLGGFVPYGYMHIGNGKPLTISPVEANVVKLIYNLYTSGEHGFQGICDILDAKKIPTPGNGKRWDKSAVRKMLQTPYYIGHIPHLGNSYPGGHEPIISEEQFRTACEMVKRRYVPRPVTADDNLLSGIIICGECGTRMRYKTKRNGTHIKSYYICYVLNGNKNMAKADTCTSRMQDVAIINRQVVEYIFKLATNPGELDVLINQQLRPTTTPLDLAPLETELATIQKKLTRWYDAYENGDIDSAHLSERVQALRIQQTTLEMQITESVTAMDTANNRILTVDMVKNAIKSLPRVWDRFDPFKKRAAIAGIIDSVTIYQDGRTDVKLSI